MLSFISRTTLRMTVVSLFIGLFVVSVGIIVSYTFQKQSDTALQVAENIIFQASGRAIEQTESFLLPIIHISNIAKNAKALKGGFHVFSTLMFSSWCKTV